MLLTFPLPLLPPPSPLLQLQLQLQSPPPSSHSFPHFSPSSSSSSSSYDCKFIKKSPRRTCLCNCSDSSASSPSTDDDFAQELERLLALLPLEMRRKASEHPELNQLMEVVMDLGRRPLARFPSGDFFLSEQFITFQDLEHATSQVGDFAVDNRAGISRTLHRISAIRNRKGLVVGLTCRAGRAISGSANLLRDLVKDDSSLLLIGPPGVGKTTIIREIARMLADDYKKRVMIVDTSNEIGGDGDIPHAGIGNARRMQVPNSDMQHKVLIEAVENHMPQVIVIDEIGTKLEAMAASTIAQRGIQLVATAHGVTIENLIMNPSLEMLVGGVQNVTLGDEEANRRGVQKTVLERKGPSTFTCGVEIISKSELRVHRSLEATVDAVLSGRTPKFEVRKRNSEGLEYEMLSMQKEPVLDISIQTKDGFMAEDYPEIDDEVVDQNPLTSQVTVDMVKRTSRDRVSIHLYVYGIPETSVMEAIKQLKVDDAVELTDNISRADALLALQARLKKNSSLQAVARSHGKLVYVTKTTSLVQIMRAIQALVSKYPDGVRDFEAEDKFNSSEKTDALEEARLAIEQVVIPKGEPVDLLPRSVHIMSLQMDLVRKYQLRSKKVGSESDGRLRILPLQTSPDEDRHLGELCENADTHKPHSESDNSDMDENSNGSMYSVDRLPLLPE